MSARLFLIRHGRSTWNAAHRIQGIADPPLDDVGLEQANRLAERLKAQPIAAIYSSPLQRARSTAEIIAHRLTAVAVINDDRLKELDVGVLTGLTWEEIVVQQPEFAARWMDEGWTTAVSGSEPQTTFRARVLSAIQDIVKQHPDQTVAVVAHGGTFNAYLAACLRLDLNRRSPFHFGNASVSIVEANSQLIEIVTLNDGQHLSGMPDIELI
jgi:broad specificity phosphatase PhoE